MIHPLARGAHVELGVALMRKTGCRLTPSARSDSLPGRCRPRATARAPGGTGTSRFSVWPPAPPADKSPHGTGGSDQIEMLVARQWPEYAENQTGRSGRRVAGLRRKRGGRFMPKGDSWTLRRTCATLSSVSLSTRSIASRNCCRGASPSNPRWTRAWRRRHRPERPAPTSSISPAR